MPYTPAPGTGGGGSGVDSTARAAAAAAQSAADGAKTTADTARADAAAAMIAATPANRRASYTFGGCESQDDAWDGAAAFTQRTRFQLTVQPTRFRVHVRNGLKLSDTAASANALTGLGAAVGRRNTATRWDIQGPSQKVTAGSSSTATGLTEWVSGWTTPTTDLTKPSVLDIEFSMTPGTSLAITNGSHSTILAAKQAGTTASLGTPDANGGPSDTIWRDYYISVTETWIEYEYAANVRQGLAVGHSFVDSSSYLGSGPWDGQNSGWPQLAARQNNQAITVDAVANASTTTYAPSSPKWNLFSDHTFDYVILDLAGNDVQAGTSADTIVTNLLGIIGKMRSTWPKARVFVANVMPNKPQDTDGGHEAIRLAFNEALNNLLPAQIDGILDYERAVALLTDPTTIDPRMLDTNGDASLRHLSNYGAAMVAAATVVR